jgi:preprotein translocase subunit SecG
MYIALIALIIFVCLLLALVVLAQNPKGGGLSNQFGAGGAANLMGVKRTGDLLERLTWGFALGLMVLTLGTHMLNGTGNAGPARSINQQRALETQLPATPAPGAPGATAPAASGTATPNERAASAPSQQPTTTPAPATAPTTGNE